MSVSFRLRLASATALFALIAVALLPASAVHAEDLPFKAWGSGRTAGQVIVALKGSTPVGQVTVNAAGAWDLNIAAGGAGSVQNGDKITFTLDGKAVNESVTWVSGQFVMPPGLVLTLSTTTTTPALPPVYVAANTNFAANPVFDTTGKSLVVFKGGSVEELSASAKAVGATGVWVQDAKGVFQLNLIGGPAFLADQFKAAFGTGFTVTSVLLVK